MYFLFFKIRFRKKDNNKSWREIAQLSIALLKTDFDSHLAELDEFEFFVKKLGFRRLGTVEL